MEVVKVFENNSNVYEMTPEAINLIHFKEGVFLMPKMPNLCQLRIVFTEHGKFVLDASPYEFQLGDCVGRFIEILLGECGMETQPCFLFSS